MRLCQTLLENLFSKRLLYKHEPKKRNGTVILLYYETKERVTLAKRARLIKSFSLRKAALRGRDCKSENKSCSSASNNLNAKQNKINQAIHENNDFIGMHRAKRKLTFCSYHSVEVDPRMIQCIREPLQEYSILSPMTT